MGSLKMMLLEISPLIVILWVAWRVNIVEKSVKLIKEKCAMCPKNAENIGYSDDAENIIQEVQKLNTLSAGNLIK